MEKELFNPDFLIIPKEVMHLPPADRFVMGAVYFMSRLSLGRCIASNVELGRICGIKAHSVTNSLDRLEAEGFIKRLYQDERKRNRTEIICLIGFGKFESSGILKTNPLLSTRESSKKEHISNTISNNNNSEDKPRTNDFSFDNYIKQVMDNSFIVIDNVKRLTNPARYFAAYYLKRKRLTFNSAAAVESAMKRHYRAAKELGEFASDMKKVSQAFNEAESLVVDNKQIPWTLETVYKQLTK